MVPPSCIKEKSFIIVRAKILNFSKLLSKIDFEANLTTMFSKIVKFTDFFRLNRKDATV